VFLDVLSQQTGRPQLLRIAQIFGFLACQVDHPGAVFVRNRTPSSSPWQIAQGCPKTQLQGFRNAALHLGSIRVESRCFRVALKYLRTLHPRGGLGSRLRQSVQVTAVLDGQMQLRASTDKGHRQ
jgi:hypothetical protein